MIAYANGVVAAVSVGLVCVLTMFVRIAWDICANRRGNWPNLVQNGHDGDFVRDWETYHREMLDLRYNGDTAFVDRDVERLKTSPYVLYNDVEFEIDLCRGLSTLSAYSTNIIRVNQLLLYMSGVVAMLLSLCFFLNEWPAGPEHMTRLVAYLTVALVGIFPSADTMYERNDSAVLTGACPSRVTGPIHGVTAMFFLLVPNVLIQLQPSVRLASRLLGAVSFVSIFVFLVLQFVIALATTRFACINLTNWRCSRYLRFAGYSPDSGGTMENARFNRVVVASYVVELVAFVATTLNYLVFEIFAK